MKKFKYYLFGLLATATMSSCDHNFVEINKNPDTVYEIDPVEFLYKAEFHMYTSGPDHASELDSCIQMPT